MKVLAELFEGIESETPYGGRAVSWDPLGSAWLKLGARRRREKTEPGGTRVTETVTAETRSDARLT
ncbi:MAG: phage head-tail adapter protein, partial [Brevundimonas sp.]|nr:phage head-tail adapter protein [Brevundimonas sp.]